MAERKSKLEEQIAPTVWEQLLLIPEAPILLVLLLIGYVYDYPPLIGGLVALVIIVFVARCLFMAYSIYYLRQAEYNQAARYARLARGINPWSADALALQAFGLVARGDHEAAEPLLRGATRLAPTNLPIHSVLAEVLLKQGSLSEGQTHATLAGSQYATQHLTWLALEANQDLVKANQLLNMVDVDHLMPCMAAPLLVLQSEAELARGALQASRIRRAELLRLIPACTIPQQAELWYHLGRLQILAGDDGTDAFRRSVDLDPQGRFAHAAWRAAVGLRNETNDNRAEIKSR